MQRIEERIATRTGERGSRKAPAPPSTCVGVSLTQSSFPLTVVDGTDYCLAEDVVINGGTAITATNASNVNIDLNGFTLTFANTVMTQILSAQNATNVNLHGDTAGGTLQHGSYRPASGGQGEFIDLLGANNCEIRNLTINVFGIGSSSSLIGNGANFTNSLHDCIINVGGWNQFNILTLASLVVHTNNINITSFNTQNYTTYSRIFERIGESYGNVIDVSEDCFAVQLWGGYGTSHTQNPHDNVIHYRANTPSSCRIFLMDSGANGWVVENNRVFVYNVAGPTYVFRLRSSDESGILECFNNTVRNNTVDSNAITEPAAGLKVFSVADLVNTRDNVFHDNVVDGPGTHIQHYLSRQAVNNAFYCNQFIHKDPSNSYLMEVEGGPCNAVNWRLSNNLFSTTRSDGFMMNKLCSGGSYDFCNNNGFTSLAQVTGTTNGVSFSSPPCAEGTQDCYTSAGAP